MNKDLNFYRDLCEKLISVNSLLSLGLDCESIVFTHDEREHMSETITNILNQHPEITMKARASLLPTIFDTHNNHGEQLRLYISSRMTGIRYYNFPAFFSMAQHMTLEGWDVVNPAQIDIDNGVSVYDLPDDWDWTQPPPNTTYDELLARDLIELESCDAILLFGDWRNSNGARTELAKAIELGLQIYEIN